MSSTAPDVAPSTSIAADEVRPSRGWFPPRIANPLPAVEALLRRDEADVVLVVGNVALVALAIIEWPIAVLAIGVHAMARSRIKALEAISEVAEEAA